MSERQRETNDEMEKQRKRDLAITIFNRRRRAKRRVFTGWDRELAEAQICKCPISSGNRATSVKYCRFGDGNSSLYLPTANMLLKVKIGVSYVLSSLFDCK